MVLVVSRHVPVHVGSGLLDGPEGTEVVRPVFHGAELGLGERVVVGDSRPVMGLADIEASEGVLEQGRTHRRPGIGMHELGFSVFGERVVEHVHRQLVDLSLLDPAADELAGVNIDDRVGLERDTSPRRPRVGDLPTRTWFGPVATSTGTARGVVLPRRVGTIGRTRSGGRTGR